MQLRLNHLDYFERIVELHEFRAVKNQLQEVLIVTNIFPGSEIDKVNCFYPGMLLSKLNGKDVCNLAQVRQALKESATTGYISFQSRENIATAVSADKVLKEEQRLTKDFMFSSTKAMVELKELRQGVVKKKKK